MSNFKGIVRCKTKSDYDGLTKDNDKLYIVDEETTATMLIEGTYDEILSIAQSGELVKGSLYKINDYVCVNDELGLGTTGMPVGIILTAVDEYNFSETCMPCSTTVDDVSTEDFAEENDLDNFNILEHSIKYSLNNNHAVETTKGYIYSSCVEYGKGSGGVSTLGIEHISIHYENAENHHNKGSLSILNAEKTGLKTTEDMFIEIVSTELPTGIEEEIASNKFAMRLDYPINYNSRKKKSQYETLPSGAGNKSFMNNLYKSGSTDDGGLPGDEVMLYELLVNSFYFVKSSDVKTKEDGTKYLKILIPVKDFINMVFGFEFNGGDYNINVFNDVGTDERTLFNHEVNLEEFASGGEFGRFNNNNKFEFGYSSSPMKMFYTKNSVGTNNEVFNKQFKKEGLFSCLFTLFTNTEFSPNSVGFYSQFFVSRRKKKLDFEFVTGVYDTNSVYRLRASKEKRNWLEKFIASVSVKPRFCIMKDDWENIGNDGSGESMFKKKFSQSEQSIAVRIPDVLFIEDYNDYKIFPVFRILVSSYKRK